jgi:hypothetical protein
MAINLTYDPSNDPETMEAEEQRDVESLEVGEKLVEEQEKLLAGKYKDAEELESAYIELQRKLGSSDGEDLDDNDSQEETEDATEEEVDNPFENDDTAQAIFQASEEWVDDGELTPETMETLSQMDSKDLVETYYRIMEHAEDPEVQAILQKDQESTEPTESTGLTDSNINDIQNAVGGEQSYNQMIQWAGENFTPQEIQAYDNALEGGNMDNINLALQALYYRYTDSVGVEGNMIQGKAAQTVDGFRSQAEVVRAMGDERYENDPAYRQDVYNKLERSNLNF